MKKISSLTKEQENLLSVYRDRWLKIGLSTESGNEEIGTEAIKEAYKVAGLNPPKVTIWCDSPLCGVIISEYLKAFHSTGKYSFKNSSSKIISDSTLMSAKNSLSETIQEVKDLSFKEFKERVETLDVNIDYNSIIFGQHDSSWLGFYQYFLEVLNLENCKKLAPLMKFAEHANWAFVFKDACIISRKPVVCKVNEAGRIHCADGPAVAYKDGVSVYGLNGVRVPEWLVMKSSSEIDPKEVMALTNAEQRKEGIKKLGMDRFKDALKVEVIHTFRDYELWTIEFEGRRIGPYLKMINDSTGQTHVEGVGEVNGGVDPNIKTCQEALAWRGGLKLYTDAKWTA